MKEGKCGTFLSVSSVGHKPWPTWPIQIWWPVDKPSACH